jgi:hypothetical protein
MSILNSRTALWAEVRLYDKFAAGLHPARRFVQFLRIGNTREHNDSGQAPSLQRFARHNRCDRHLVCGLQGKGEQRGNRFLVLLILPILVLTGRI